MQQETQLLFEDNTHNFKVLFAPCLVTGQFDKVVLAKLTEVDFTDEHGEVKTAEIFGQFSANGLQMLQEALQSAPLPIPLETPDQVRQGMNYQWLVIYESGKTIQQFEKDRREHHLGHVDLHQVAIFWVFPRDPGSNLPAFCLNRSAGLCRAESMFGPIVPLDLPFPTVPFHIEYQRRVTKTFTAGAPGYMDVPTQVQHEFGWRVDKLQGDSYETTLVIAIEDSDGSWQIAKKEPLESRHFHTDPLAFAMQSAEDTEQEAEEFRKMAAEETGSRQIDAEHGVRVMEMIS